MSNFPLLSPDKAEEADDQYDQGQLKRYAQNQER